MPPKSWICPAEELGQVLPSYLSAGIDPADYELYYLRRGLGVSVEEILSRLWATHRKLRRKKNDRKAETAVHEICEQVELQLARNRVLIDPNCAWGVVEHAADLRLEEGAIIRAERYLNVATGLLPTLDLAEQEKKQVHGLALEHLGNIHMHRDRLDEALETYAAAERLYRQLAEMERPTTVALAGAECHLQPSYVYYRTRAIQMAKTQGVILYMKGLLDDAVEIVGFTLKEAERMHAVSPTDFVVEIAVAQRSLGTVYTAKGQVDQAIEYHRRSLEILQSVEVAETEPAQLAAGHLKLAAAHIARGEVDNGLSELDRAETFVQFEKGVYRSMIERQRTKACKKTGSMKEALEHGRAVLKETNRFGLLLERRKILALLPELRA